MDVDLNFLLHRRQLSLMIAGRALALPERRMQDQFSREYAEQIRFARDALGARCPRPGSVA
jgi:hypothetical protein